MLATLCECESPLRCWRGSFAADFRHGATACADFRPCQNVFRAYLLVFHCSNCSEEVYKVVVVGDSHVGKTSLLQRFQEDTFTMQHHPTVGADYVSLPCC